MKRYLAFGFKKKHPKTTEWWVQTKKDLEGLGVIKWYAPWRQYCFFPYSDVVWARGCLNEVVEFIQELMDERKIIVDGEQ